MADCAHVSHGALGSRPPPNASNPAGTARAPFHAGIRGCPSTQSREGVEALPYYVWGRFRRATDVVRRPKAGRRGRRPLRAVCILRVAAYNVVAQPAHHFVRAIRGGPSTEAGRAWKPSPTRRPPFTYVGRNPSVTPLRGATAPLSGETRAWAEAVALSHLLPTIPMPPFRAYGLALRI